MWCIPMYNNIIKRGTERKGKEMSYGTVTRICEKCGKEYEIRKKFMNRREADSWEEYMNGFEKTNGLCRECYHEKMEAERAAKEAEDVAKAEQFNMVELNGSEKQIAWANKIRAKLVLMVTEQRNVNDTFWEYVNKKTDASWWIEHRDIYGYKEFAEALLK